MASLRGFNLAKLSQIRVVFSSFDNRISSAREFLRRVSAHKMSESNPKCRVTTDIKDDLSNPFIEVTFSDGSTLYFDAVKSSALQMVAQINIKARTL
ncbi:hypothetical protein EMCRGX_G014995 [Ephydatia muelleri]